MNVRRTHVVTLVCGALTACSLLLAGPASADAAGSGDASVGAPSHAVIQDSGGVLDWIEATNPGSGAVFNNQVDHHNVSTSVDGR